MTLLVWSHQNLQKEAIQVLTNRVNFRGLSQTQSILQPRPQGFSLKKWVGRPTHLREKPWGRGCQFFSGDLFALYK